MLEAATEPRAPTDHAGMASAFRRYENGLAVDNARRAAALAALFMLAGTLLDWIVFSSLAWSFLLIRAACTLLLCVVFWSLGVFQREISRTLVAQAVALVPMIGICWMIAMTGGGDSIYYAGLNLVLLGLSLLLRWSFWNSLAMILLCFAAYAVSVMLAPHQSDPATLFNNAYFLFVTGVFVLAGSYFYEQVRFREFILRKEVEDAREELQEKNRQLSELDEAKTRFFANISHELRTPLTVIIGLNERLQNRLKNSQDKEVADMVGMIEHNGLRLLKLIDDLLDLVRFDTGHADLRTQPTDTRSLIDGLMRSMQHLADQGGVALQWEVDSKGSLMLDRDKIEKVLLNLTINAIKFTPAGGQIDVRIERDGPGLKLEVSDTGVGIPANVLPRIFERFWQVDSSSTRKFQGAGIGLALVNTLVEAMHGRIDATSTVGKGTTFSIVIPVDESLDGPEELAEAEETGKHIGEMHRKAVLAGARRLDLEPERGAAPGRAVAGHTPGFGARRSGARPLVLVADDEPDMRSYLVMQLQDEDAEVIQARDGAEALELAKQRLPVLALIDHMMPEMDGVEVCRAIRENHGTREMPVVMLTARADEQTKLSALEAGASDFLTKPFSTTELVLRLRNQLAMARIRRELSDLNRDLENALDQLKENEVLLIRNEKLSALGRMSAGIIHEINNPLNYTQAAVHALESFRKMLPEEEHEDYLDILGDIREGIERVSTIIADLRQFTRDDSRPGGAADLVEIVEQARRMVGHQFGSSVAFHMDAPEKAPMSANGNQLVQVVMNLFQNALDAIQERVAGGDDGPGRIDCRIRAAAGGWELTVRDNGIGIPAGQMNKIYDPFYTSKDVGKGMGLGLSITHQIIERHRGHIEVESQPGKFTQFTLFFPPPDPEDDPEMEQSYSTASEP